MVGEPARVKREALTIRPAHLVDRRSSEASVFGFGGVVTLPNGRAKLVAGIRTEKEVKMSRMTCKVIGFLRLLEVTAQLFPKMIKDLTVQLIGDN
jgi:hypothetical protein